MCLRCDYQEFGFVLVEFKFIDSHPGLNVFDHMYQLGECTLDRVLRAWITCEIYLYVVSIHVIVNIVFLEDIGNRLQVQSEQQGP